MNSSDLARQTLQAVLECQQQFWVALERKDADLLSQVLADDFVCRSPGQADQQRSAFIEIGNRFAPFCRHSLGLVCYC